MTLKKRITDSARKVFNITLYQGHPSWSQVSSLARTYSADRVIEVFEEWAASKAGEQIEYPLSRFLRVADGLLAGDTELQQIRPEARELMKELAYISKGDVLFDDRQTARIGKLLGEYTADEIKLAFRQFYTALPDDFALKMAPKRFTETAEQSLRFLRRHKQQSEAEMKQALAESDRLRAESDARAAERRRQQEEERRQAEEDAANPLF